MGIDRSNVSDPRSTKVFVRTRRSTGAVISDGDGAWDRRRASSFDVSLLPAIHPAIAATIAMVRTMARSRERGPDRRR